MQDKRAVIFCLTILLLAGTVVGYAAVPQSTIQTTVPGGITTYVGHYVNSTLGYWMGTNEVISALRAASFITLDTGHGANELYAMNQDVETTDAVTFLTVDTGQGANELYQMNQDLETTDSPEFVNLTLSGDILNGYNTTDKFTTPNFDLVGVNQASPLAFIHVGALLNEYSSNSQILISSLVEGASNAHAYSDSSQLDISGNKAYNSYDARIKIIGTEDYAHYAGFQFAPNITNTGQIDHIYGYISCPIIYDATITNNYGFFSTNPNLQSGTITNNYGSYIADQTAGTNDYGLYIAAQTEGLNAVFAGGGVQIIGTGTAKRGLNMSNGADIWMGDGDIYGVDDIEGRTGGSMGISSRRAAGDGIVIQTTDLDGITLSNRLVFTGGADTSTARWTDINQTGIVNGGIFGNINQATTLGNGVTTFAVTKDFVTLTGDGGANTVSTITGGIVGQTLTILCVDGLITITDTDAHNADTVDLSAGFTSADDTILSLIYDGTSWYETGRSVN